jgi:NAD(P)-dependent dehydrogenase (short-subunit alcohol dehydrogenase family)
VTSVATRPAPLTVRLDGRHAIVTGAGRGIGRSIALALLEAGAGVTLVARSQDQLEEVAAAADGLDGEASVHVADVRSEEQVEAAADAAMANGGVDICINCAGVNRPGPTVDATLEDWDRIIATNLTGAFLMCRAVGRRLLEAGKGGRIINISSQMGAVGYPGRAMYCASKHGLDGLTRALGVEWAKDGILVNSIAPTFIYTPLTRPMFEDQSFKDDVLRRMPMGRIMEPEEINGSVLYLCSDAASMVTGEVLRCDGGWVAW